MGVVIGDVIQVTCGLSWEGVSDMLNVFYVQKTMGDEDDDIDVLTDLASGFDTVYALIQAYLHTDVIFGDIEFYNITQDRPMGAVDWPTLLAGTGEADPLGIQSAYQVDFFTGVKRSRGRKYISGGMAINLADAARLKEDTKGVLQDWGDQLVLGFLVDSDEYLVGHIGSVSGLFISWKSALVAPLISTQRRRKPTTGS